MSNCSASCTSVRSPLIAAIATFALKADVWFRRGLLLMLSPDSRAKSCPLSGRSSTYRPVQILEAGSNGLLLRTDIHRLLDLGYVTISRHGHFEVGRRLNEHFENGRHYYAMHGQALSLPENLDQRPSREVIEWHQTQRFLG